MALFTYYNEISLPVRVRDLPYTEARDTMIHTIESGYVCTNCPPHLRTMDLTTLLGDNPHLPTQTRELIMDAANTFIHDMPRQF